MKMVFRWNGMLDPLKPELIRRIPCMYGIAASLNQIETGELWPENDIKQLRKTIESAGLTFEVVSLLPIHEDILPRQGKWRERTDNYKENIARCASEGVKCICYGFSRDCRVDLNKPKTTDLWDCIGGFIDEIIPVAAKHGIKMAMDVSTEPLASCFISDEDEIDRYLSFSKEREHGLALCSGLEMPVRNNYRKMVRKYGAMGRVHFADLRNVKILEDVFFVESEFLSQCVPLGMAHILKAFHDADFNGYVCPGNGYVTEDVVVPAHAFRDVALGATYLSGIWESLEAFGY